LKFYEKFLKILSFWICFKFWNFWKILNFKFWIIFFIILEFFFKIFKFLYIATSTRLLRILTESNSTSNPVLVSSCVIYGADYCASLQNQIPPVTLYWFPFASFLVQGILSISAMIWNQNIAISTIVGTLSHIIAIAANTIL
jgi:hypothetical protein